MLRWLTAGESHGPALMAMLEGLPAGVQVTTADVAAALARRRLGFGRGARMKFEQDEVEFLGGVRHGVTLGGPVAIRIGNTEWPKWETVMSPDPVDRRRARGATTWAPAGGGPNRPLTRPRPGHADLVGMQKYGFDDARPVLERATARETAARVALGSVASRFLEQAVGVRLVSHIVAIGTAGAPDDAVLPTPDDVDALDADPVRCLDPAAVAAMVAEVEAARKDGDTLGGVVEVVAYGLPPGLGSHVHWDRRLDAQLAAALMGIQAIKGVEVGDGFRTAARRGSAAHDEIERDAAGVIQRRTGRAGGTEGGMSTGEVLRVRAAMKPIATVPRALDTVDVAIGEPAKAIHQRSRRLRRPGRRRGGRGDGRAGAGARPCSRSSAATASPRPPATTAATSTRSPRRCARGERRRPPAGRARRAAGVGQDHGRGAGRVAARRRLPRHRPAPSRQAAGRSISEIFVEDGEATFRALERREVAGVARRPRRCAVAGRRLRAATRTPSGCWPVTPSSTSQVGIADAAKRVGFDRSRPLLALQPRAAWVRLMDQRRGIYERLAVHCVDTAGRTPEDIAAEIVTLLEDTAVSDQTRIPVTGDTPYDVVIGTGPARRAAGSARRAGSSGCWSSTRAPCGRRGRPSRDDLAAQGFSAFVGSRCPTPRRPRPPRWRRSCWGVLGQAGFTRSDAVVGVGGGATTDLGRLRRGDLAARRAGRARARPRCSAWSTRRSAARPASTPPRARTWSARSTRRPGCCATWPRWRRCRATTSSRAGRGGQVRLHRRPGDPRPRRGRPRGGDAARRRAGCAS